ncbi:MAG TPA: hypothetical protein PK413_13740, partial [Thermoanaerobaculia bacterium]|nr:hypothetical protein [Thermoanaerobaculia bacterium]
GRADLALSMTASPEPVGAGNTLTYTLVAQNLGPGEASGVVLTNTLPASVTLLSFTPPATACSGGPTGTLSCTLGTLAPSSSFTLVLTTNVAAGAPASLTNVATLLGSQPDPVPANNSATAVSTVGARFDLDLAMTDAPDPVAVAGSLLYTLTLTNHGPGTASTVALSDTLPNGLSSAVATPAQGSCAVAGAVVSCQLGNLASPATVTVTIQATVGPSAPASLTNTASVTAPGQDLVPANNSATATTGVNRSADLSLTVTDMPDPVAAGGTLGYHVTVANAGPADADSVVVTFDLAQGLSFGSTRRLEPLGSAGAFLIFADGFETGDTSAWAQVVGGPPPPSGCSQVGSTLSCALGTVAAGGSTTLDLSLHVGAGVAGSLTTTATVSSGVGDPQGTNNQVMVVTTLSRSGDLAIEVSDAPDPVSPGGTLVYTFTVTNGGPSSAQGVTFNDPLPPELSVLSVLPTQGSCLAANPVQCDLGTLGPASQALVEIRARVSSSATGFLTNTASVDATEGDPNLVNNLATAVTGIAGTARGPRRP